jgi:hypothetical protein
VKALQQSAKIVKTDRPKFDVIGNPMHLPWKLSIEGLRIDISELPE